MKKPPAKPMMDMPKAKPAKKGKKGGGKNC